LRRVNVMEVSARNCLKKIYTSEISAGSEL